MLSAVCNSMKWERALSILSTQDGRQATITPIFSYHAMVAGIMQISLRNYQCSNTSRKRYVFCLYGIGQKPIKATWLFRAVWESMSNLTWIQVSRQRCCSNFLLSTRLACSSGVALTKTCARSQYFSHNRTKCNSATWCPFQVNTHHYLISSLSYKQFSLILSLILDLSPQTLTLLSQWAGSKLEYRRITPLESLAAYVHTVIKEIII